MTSPAWRVVPRVATNEMCDAAMQGRAARTITLPDGSKLLRDPDYFNWVCMCHAAPRPDYDAMAVELLRELHGYRADCTPPEYLCNEMAAALRGYFEGKP